jgi:hypothetical protein
MRTGCCGGTPGEIFAASRRTTYSERFCSILARRTIHSGIMQPLYASTAPRRFSGATQQAGFVLRKRDAEPVCACRPLRILLRCGIPSAQSISGHLERSWLQQPQGPRAQSPGCPADVTITSFSRPCRSSCSPPSLPGLRPPIFLPA